MSLEICPICDKGELELYVWLSDIDGATVSIPCTAHKCSECDSVVGGWFTTKINKLIRELYK